MLSIKLKTSLSWLFLQSKIIAPIVADPNIAYDKIYAVTCGINHGLCSAGIKLFACISGLRRFTITNTVATTAVKLKSQGGAGVQTEVIEGQTLTYTEDGGMLVSGFNQAIPNLAYVVGKVSDHILEYNNEKFSLREICGSGAYVTFELK